MLENLFGNPVIEKVLFSLLVNEETYGAELSKELKTPLFSVQKALMRLEKGGIIVSQLQGKTRIYRFNPRYPMLPELKQFLSKAYSFIPPEIQSSQYAIPKRKRPRRAGKP